MKKERSWFQNRRFKSSPVYIKDLENVILLGFSEGAMYALDIALKYSADKKIVGVISIAPPYSTNVVSKSNCDLSSILIVSKYDQNVLMKESLKWKRHFNNMIVHETNKGHKVHYPAVIKDEIIKMMDSKCELSEK